MSHVAFVGGRRRSGRGASGGKLDSELLPPLSWTLGLRAREQPQVRTPWRQCCPNDKTGLAGACRGAPPGPACLMRPSGMSYVQHPCRVRTPIAPPLPRCYSIDPETVTLEQPAVLPPRLPPPEDPVFWMPAPQPPHSGRCWRMHDGCVVSCVTVCMIPEGAGRVTQAVATGCGGTANHV